MLMLVTTTVMHQMPTSSLRVHTNKSEKIIRKAILSKLQSIKDDELINERVEFQSEYFG